MSKYQALKDEVEATFRSTQPGESPPRTMEEIHRGLKKRGLTNRRYKTKILVKSLVKSGQLTKTKDGKYQENTEA